MDNHQKIKELIPWYVNGTLSESELDRINYHMKVCPECCKEVESEIRMASLLCVQPQQLQQLENRREEIAAQLFRNINTPALDAVTQQPPGPKALLKQRNKWFWAMAASLVFGVAVPSFILGRHSQEAPYIALTAPSSYSGEVVQVIFDANTSETEIARVLLQSGGQLLNEPGTSKVYRLGLAPGTDAEKFCAQMRLDPAIRWAEVERK